MTISTEKIIKIRMEREISSKIKQDIFLLTMFDKLLEESELTEKEIDEIDHQVKRGIMGSTGWK
jgi:Zn-dependent M16 (insulinase) family peptidase